MPQHVSEMRWVGRWEGCGILRPQTWHVMCVLPKVIPFGFRASFLFSLQLSTPSRLWSACPDSGRCLASWSSAACRLVFSPKPPTFPAMLAISFRTRWRRAVLSSRGPPAGAVASFLSLAMSLLPESFVMSALPSASTAVASPVITRHSFNPFLVLFSRLVFDLLDIASAPTYLLPFRRLCFQ